MISSMITLAQTTLIFGSSTAGTKAAMVASISKIIGAGTLVGATHGPTMAVARFVNIFETTPYTGSRISGVMG
jgi:hypothetical protein